MSKNPIKKKGQRRGKYVGGYVDDAVFSAIQDEARLLDRSRAWLIKKILAAGVKHRMEAA